MSMTAYLNGEKSQARHEESEFNFEGMVDAPVELNHWRKVWINYERRRTVALALYASFAARMSSVFRSKHSTDCS